MLINRKGIICHVSRVWTPYRIWYPINLLIPQYGEKYINEKLGITKPEEIKYLQESFSEDQKKALEETPEFLEAHNLRYDKYGWPIYLADKNEKSMWVFLDRGLSPEVIKPEGRHPGGYAWARIERSNTPDEVNEWLYCHDLKFARALHKKLKEIMNW